MHSYPRGCFFRQLSDIKDSRITVMGLGLNGGGLASVRFFLQHGAHVTVTDMKDEKALAPAVNSLVSDTSLDTSRLRFVLGRHEIADFTGANAVIKNPGVKYEGNPYLAAAKVIETDISVFLSFTQAPIIAVTGSKGKSSTASAIHYGLTKAGFNAFLGGNITVSPLTFLERTNSDTPTVLELSSWQLADLRGRDVLKPHIALITKIVPDHQNWYGNMENYVSDKKLIYAGQDASCWTICESPENGSDSSAWGGIFGRETNGRVLYYGNRAPVHAASFGAWFDEKGRGVIRLPADPSGSAVQDGRTHTALETLAVPGGHMKINALNAALVLALMGVHPDQTSRILSSWQGIPHRLEFFLQWDIPGKNSSVLFYNDSAATVPEAAAEAARSFAHPVYLICGGTDKELDFEPLAAAISAPHASKPHAVYLLAGSGTDKLIQKLQPYPVEWEGPFGSLALLLARLKNDLLTKSPAAHRQIVVFSPGATSFGMFRNEFDRGEQFKQAVSTLFAQH